MPDKRATWLHGKLSLSLVHTKPTTYVLNNEVLMLSMNSPHVLDDDNQERSCKDKENAVNKMKKVKAWDTGPELGRILIFGSRNQNPPEVLQSFSNRCILPLRY